MKYRDLRRRGGRDYRSALEIKAPLVGVSSHILSNSAVVGLDGVHEGCMVALVVDECPATSIGAGVESFDRPNSAHDSGCFDTDGRGVFSSRARGARGKNRTGNLR